MCAFAYLTECALTQYLLDIIGLTKLACFVAHKLWHFELIVKSFLLRYGSYTAFLKHVQLVIIRRKLMLFCRLHFLLAFVVIF